MSAIPIPDWLCDPVLALSELVCCECGATFASRTALAVHSRILHGSVNDADQRVVGTICLRCRKQFHSRPRLVAHLQRGSADCLAAYLDHVPPLDLTYFQELNKEDALIRKKRKGMGLSDLHAVLPVVKIAGSRLPPPLPGTLELCRARPVVPRLEEHCEDEHVHVPSIPPPCTICMQFILCLFGGCRKEGDVQAQIERIFAKEGRTAAVLSPQGDASCFNLEFWMSLIRANRVRALYIPLPMHSWNEVSGSAQQLRSLDKVCGENGLSLASCQVLRKANFSVQCSLLLMVTARTVRVPALWCHPAGVDRSSVPSLWQLPELSWLINDESFGKIMVDHCAFGIARRRWRVPLTLLYTSVPSLNEVVECCPSRFRCQGGHQHHERC